jgi:anti-sigma factor RsiW
MRRDDELLAAYVDGVTELTTEERRHVEERLAADPTLRLEAQQTRAVLDQLRSLPSEGTEPDWSALERSIRGEVGDVVPRSWWRLGWRWLVPATALVLAAAVFALWIRGPKTTVAPADERVVAVPHDAGEPTVAEVEYPAMTIWLDGEEVEVDLAADELLEVDGVLLGEEDSLSPGLLPVDNLAWIDELDLDEADLADAWLGRKKG